jgi:exopolyphosphatase/guanosine-5'-triphosphate,3'-diphosphate pyrophosphatase
MQERIAIIDLGSNTARMVVFGYTPHHSYKLLDEVRETVRLAEGVGADGKLTPARMARGVEVMKLFHAFCRATGVAQIVPVATSATRDATNQAEFTARVQREAGLALRVLSMDEEAYYGYVGAANALDLRDAFLIDIGGGSVEVGAIRGRGLVQTFSRPAGVVRFTERYIHSDPISNKDFKALEAAATDLFAGLDWLAETHGATLAGIGGTIRTLAEIDQRARPYPLALIHGYVLTRERLEALIDQLRGLTVRQRADVPGLSRDRADLILAGAVILHQLMRQGRFDGVTVSGPGLREGLFFEQFLIGENPPLFPDVRGAGVRNLARIHNYETLHTAKVRDLAWALFDALAPLHGYGAWERTLLGYAALLHDIGVDVSYYDHDMHGAYLILNSALPGFSHRELVLLALLVRYHHKGAVRVEEYRAVLQAGDEARVARLAALLRLAENLDRSKSQVVQGLSVELGDSLRAVTRTGGDATVEIWDANRNADLFEKAFGREITIE